MVRNAFHLLITVCLVLVFVGMDAHAHVGGADTHESEHSNSTRTHIDTAHHNHSLDRDSDTSIQQDIEEACSVDHAGHCHNGHCHMACLVSGSRAGNDGLAASGLPATQVRWIARLLAADIERPKWFITTPVVVNR